jgi:AcrR family transcriptional regulator
MDDRPTLRHRVRLQTAAEIEAASFALFAEHGFEATTVEQIAARVGISPRTFFRYFPTKEAVVFAHHEGELARFRQALADQPASMPPVEKVFAAMSQSASPWPAAHGRERQRLIQREPALRAHEARLGEELEDVVAAEIAASCGGGADGRLHAAIVAGAIFGGLRGARRGWTHAPLRSPHDLFAAAQEVLAGMAGNATPRDSTPTPDRGS